MAHRSRHVERLAQRALICGALTEDALATALAGLINRDPAAVATSLAITVPITGVVADMEAECLAILASNDVVAADLRFVRAVLRLAGDLESIAEVSHSAARHAHDAVTAGPREIPTAMLVVGALTIDMVHDVVAAVACRDLRLAHDVVRRHAAVRRSRGEVWRWTIRRVQSGRSGGDGSLHVGWIARNLEDIAAIAASTAVDFLSTTENWPIFRDGSEDADELRPAPVLW
ncbi:MAG: phosphate signaling complex PhoU family protein [Planctomycetaceae bacterium]